jgi:hypothetical protein
MTLPVHLIPESEYICFRTYTCTCSIIWQTLKNPTKKTGEKPTQTSNITNYHCNSLLLEFLSEKNTHFSSHILLVAAEVV